MIEGFGNPESYNTSSYGAGCRFTRQAAKKYFSTEEVMVYLE